MQTVRALFWPIIFVAILFCFMTDCATPKLKLQLRRQRHARNVSTSTTISTTSISTSTLAPDSNGTATTSSHGKPRNRHNLDNVSVAASSATKNSTKLPASGELAATDAATSQEQALLADGDTRVPFWSIVHMINSISQIELALNAGANAIESDISFNKQGAPTETYHGFPCDCGRHCHFRENFVEFVRYLGHISTPPESSRLQLVLFDLKLKDLKLDEQLTLAGTQLAKILHEHLYLDYELTFKARNKTRSLELPPMNPPLRVVISINYSKDVALVKAFIGEMRRNRWDFMSQQVGFDVGMNDNLQNISSMWDSLNGATFNIWQGDGLTNCANIIRGVERLKEVLNMRNNQGHFRKVYYWTADILYHIRSVLRLGLDAVLTNQPQRVLQVLQEPEFKVRYRMATPYDNPFEQFWIQPTAWKMSAPTLNEAVETVQNIGKTSSDFIKTLPAGLSAAIKKVHSTFV